MYCGFGQAAYLSLALSLMLSSGIVWAVERVTIFTGDGKLWNVYGTRGGTSSWHFLQDAKDWEACSCSQASCSTPTPNTYLVTGYFDVQKAKKVFLGIHYTVQKCASNLKASKGCVEHIGLYALRTNNSLAGKDPFKNANYIFVANTSTENLQAGFTEKIFKASVATDNAKGIIFGFQDVGYCGVIKQVNISYIQCPTRSLNLLTFPTVSAPASGKITVPGQCTVNSALEGSTKAEMTCNADGTSVVTGKCLCLPGFEKKDTRCEACGSNYYKEGKGNHKCSVCGKNSAPTSLRTKCICNSQYIRPVKYPSDSSIDCEKPPSKPEDLKVENITSGSAVLVWKAPGDLGTGGSIFYDVVCANCPSDALYADNITDTKAKLTLQSYAFYTFEVISVNNVSDAIQQARKAAISFRTLTGVPSAVRNVKWKVNSDGSITLSWDPPFAPGGPDLVYIVSYGGNTKETKATNLKIEKPATKKTYIFKVQARTSAGTSPAESTPELSMEGAVPLKLVALIAVPFLVLLVVAIAVAIFFWKRRHPKHLQAVRLENGEVIIPSSFKGQKVYVDPMTYQDLTEAVSDVANPLEKSWIELENIIGGGEFGDVYKGTLTKPFENARSVAIKTLRTGANKQARDDFLSEAAIMGQFNDPNVIVLEGVVVREKPMMIVTEFMSNGSLDSFLQANDGKFTPLQLLGMARGVSSGMTYLSEMGFIHRDLAARNILVSDSLRCKVADFGMSRELKMDDTYDTRGGKIPVRWTAPEAIQWKKFTTASDVWSFGILLWEILSFGERPYWDWGNYEVLERIGSGYRLPPPMGCPKVVHDLMLSCWHKDRVKRPKFRSIRDTIDKWIRNPESLSEEDSYVVKRDEHLNYASMKTIKEWLDSIKMGQYTKNFVDAGFATPRQILSLTEEDLVDLKITIIGHRRKIFKSIQATKRQMEHPPLLERENSIKV